MSKLCFILALALSCVSWRVARQAASDLPEQIDAAGRQMRLRVEGEGSPTVVLEIGLAGALEENAAVQRGVAQFTRVVALDRIGADHSQPVVTGRQIARELHAALENAHLPPPYVLVGQSFGGIYNRIFASRYPDEVAGLVLLDPAQEEFIAWMKEHYPKEEFSNKKFKNWPEATGVNATLVELKTAGPLPDVPVVVVTAAKPSSDRLSREVRPVWTSMHETWAKSLPHGRHIVTEQSGHGIHVEQPELVVQLVREVIEESRRRH